MFIKIDFNKIFHLYRLNKILSYFHINNFESPNYFKINDLL